MSAEYFYWIDLAIALSVPVVFIVLYAAHRIGRFSWLMYWIGCGIGALWGIPCYFIGPAFSSDPLYVLKTPIPYPLFLLHVLHCFWDGGFLVVGVFLVKKLCRGPISPASGFRSWRFCLSGEESKSWS